MKKFSFFLFLILVSFQIPAVQQSGHDIHDTKLLNQPAISKDHIAFVYAGDLWTADLNGKNVKRLTSDEGSESDPVFSPDGKLIAFSAQYDGNTDVFVVPVEGGIPKRLTWHPGSDQVRGFTPDGKNILFISSRFVFTNRYAQLFTVPVSGGFPEALKIPNAFKADYSPDGKQIAYTPLGERFHQWKNYRGGTVSRILLCDLKDFSVEQVPQPQSSCNDTDPMWEDGMVYFRSDRNGEFNIFSFDLKTEGIQQLTDHKDFPVLNASAYKDKIIYEQAGYLHIYNISTLKSRKLTIGIAADHQEVRSRYVSNSRFIRNTSISPSGARAVFEYRGEIVTVPEKKGDPRNLTNTPGAHERDPVWSPDGKNIAYFSDESGEYKLLVKPQDGKGEAKSYKLNGSGFYTFPVWSPDSKKLTFADNSRGLYWIDLESGKIKKIDSEPLYFPGAFGSIQGIWTPDSKWIVYTKNTLALFQQVFIHSIDQNKSFAITDGLSDVSDPVIDNSGKYIYFFASTDAGPVKHWFAMSNADMRISRNIYLVTMEKETPSPLAKESDEEKIKKEEKEAEKPKKADDKKEKTPDFKIEFDGLQNRIISLPIGTGNLYNLQSGADGIIYYLEALPNARGPFSSGTKLHKYDLEKRKDEVIVSNANDYIVSFDNKKILYRSGSSWFITSASSKAKAGEGKLKTDNIEVKIDPLKEWKQIFDEAWRVNRDYFYATNMHGADWPTMKKKYSAFLPHVVTRQDLNRIIMWMCSEVSVGHHRVGGGDYLNSPERVGGGLLGADYSIENNRYRFAKIYGGLNWNPGLRSPLTEPGVNVNTGDYLIAVNGKELTASDNIFSYFEKTAGKIVEITVSKSPDGKDPRTVNVVPVSGEGSLRNRDWVEGNIKKVHEATDGRVAYVYVPNTSTLGHTYFKRYFFPQADKDAIIVDERFNGGGSIADYYIDLLRRPFISYWNMRYCEDYRSPSGSIQGPKVMLIDETAGSGGDLLPWMFRKFNLGKLIGKKTWGGLVGTLGFPTLMDGGYVTAPNIAIWAEDGWVVENVGVPPDIEVEQTPADVIAGHDPQLEKAIDVIMEELKNNPPKKLKRPPYPVRVRK
ncbi:PDZ domain-containing protein [candidate division KSB1 bacterium]